ncbi:MAG: DUF4382 domain-containing protein [Bacteroidia bacterium]|nr:DUF4382 domain-containing protein [Bacteroidia bacterium]
MKILRVLLLPLLALSFVACDEDSTTPSTTGTLSVRLTDAPADYDAVRITFAEIAAHIDDKWVTVNGNPVTVNLLEWNNGKSIEIGRAELGPGKYTQIRLMVTKAELDVDGKTWNLDIPSADQTGLKLNGNFDVVAGSTYELMLDFDASKSIVRMGPPNNPNGYKLQPTIRVIEKGMSGSVGGKVQDTPVTALATVSQNGADITSTPVDEITGEFLLAFLAPGTYTVRVEDVNGKIYTAADVIVEAGKKTDLGMVQLQ